MGRTRPFLVSFGCAVAISASALAATVIPPASLLAHPDEMPGFATAKVKVQSATSATRYVRTVLDESGHEGRVEVTRLEHKGFKEGAQEMLTGQQGVALSTAVVYGSARVAEQELKASISEDLKAQGKATIKRFTVDAIPGSLGFSAREPGHPGGAANVSFATGRCLVLVGDSLRTSKQGVSIAPTAGAVAVYQRVKKLCA